METAGIVTVRSSASFTVGGVLSRSFSLMFRKFGLFFSLTLLATVAGSVIASLLMIAIANWLPGSRITGMPLLFTYVSFTGLISNFFSSVCNHVFLGACGWAVFQLDKGEKATFMQAMKVLLGNLHHALGTAAVYAGLVTVSIFGFYIPVFFIACFLIASVPACVAERLDVRTALKRSVDLTRGSRWKILALVILTGIMNAAVQWAYLYIQPSILGYGLASNTTFLYMKPIIWLFAMAIKLPTTFTYLVFYAVIYSRLRAAREGGIGGLARVFD